MKPLDKIDEKILSILQKQGRITNAALAMQVNLSATPCLERVKRLERDGYICGYHARLNANHLKSGFVTFMTVSLTRTTEDVFDRFAKSIAGFDEVAECHMVGGGFDYILKIRTESMSAFRKFMSEQLSTLPEVAQTHSYFVMEAVKNDRFIKVSE